MRMFNDSEMAMAGSVNRSQHSMIGKSIKISGEIEASAPLYIQGCVEGTINAPTHRVTVGKEGRVNADIIAGEVLIMGEVRGDVDGADRVEIRKEGSLTGNLAARRVCIEDGAFLTGIFDVCLSIDGGKPEAHEEPDAALGGGTFYTAAGLKLAGD